MTKVHTYIANADHQGNHIDMAGKKIQLGDIVAYAGAGYNTGLKVGRVIRLCPKQAVMMEALHQQKKKFVESPTGKTRAYVEVGKFSQGDWVNDGDPIWTLSEAYVKKCEEALVIANPAATIPMEVWEMFENLEITGKRPKPEKKK